MPYTAVNKRPIRHDLFDKFLVYSADKGISTLIFIDILICFHGHRFIITAVLLNDKGKTSEWIGDRKIHAKAGALNCL